VRVVNVWNDLPVIVLSSGHYRHLSEPSVWLIHPNISLACTN